jgi:hypothetical protein
MLRTLKLALLALAAISVAGFAPLACAQDRPLQTTDAEVVPAGTLRAQAGFDFLQDATFPLSGLRGDLTSVGVLNARLGLGRAVEVALDGTVQNFLDVKSRGASFVPNLQLTGVNSTHDVGDFALSTKIRIFGEEAKRPSLAFRFGFIMPNTNQARGIGLNATHVFALVPIEKHIHKLKLFADAGIEIMTAPNALYTQNDVLLYGAAFSYPVWRRVDLVGEVNGRYSDRDITPALLGTQSSGQARLGLRVSVGGFVWDVAGIAGLNKYDPHTGFTLGVRRDFHIFHTSSAQ